MKKYLIRDEDNMSYEITEIEENDEKEVPVEETPVETPTETPEENTEVLDNLSSEEVSVLKKLIPYADKLIALVSEEEVPAEEDEMVEDEEEEIDEDEEEEIVDTEAKDSINKSATSTKKQQKVNDSYDDTEDDVSETWANRYQKFKKGESVL